MGRFFGGLQACNLVTVAVVRFSFTSSLSLSFFVVNWASSSNGSYLVMNSMPIFTVFMDTATVMYRQQARNVNCCFPNAGHQIGEISSMPIGAFEKDVNFPERRSERPLRPSFDLEDKRTLSQLSG
jgi:hypothetical protein